MKKQIRQWLIATIAFLSAIPVLAHDVVIDGIYYNLNNDDKTASVTFRENSYGSYSDRYAGHIKIPASVKSSGITYRVTGIGNYAFYRCGGLTTVDIPSSVTSIGNYVFAYCSNITAVNIPNSVTSIGDGAFWTCQSLTSVDIPNSVTIFGSAVFENCISLTSVNIPNSITDITLAFYGCRSLTSVNIPNSVTDIGAGAFSGCVSLTSVNIPNSVTNIGADAFSGCVSLASVNIPSSVTSIWSEAFSGCVSLTSVNIPSSVTDIEERAFLGCSSLLAVNVDGGNSSFSSEDGVLFNKDKSHILLFPGGKKGDYTIPSTVNKINQYAFYDCAGLATVTLPASFEYASNKQNYFSNCSSLTAINVNGEDGLISSKDGVLYNKEQTQLLAFPCGRSGEYTIPSFVSAIGAEAFMGCSRLACLRIPESVKSIDGSALSGCNLFLVIEANEADLSKCCSNLGTESVVFVSEEDMYVAVRESWPHDVRMIGYGSPYRIKDVTTYLKGFSFKIDDITQYAPDLFTDEFSIAEVGYGDWTGTVTPDANGTYTKFGLPVDKVLLVSLRYARNGVEQYYLEDTVYTKKPYISVDAAATQTTATIRVIASKGDESAKLKEVGFIINDDKYPVDFEEYNDINVYGAQLLSGLTLGTRFYVKPYAIYGDETVTGNSEAFHTIALVPEVNITDITSTSFSISTSMRNIDATITDTSITLNGEKVDNFRPTGLEPGSRHDVVYTITAEEGDAKATATVTLPALELTTLKPKGVSSTCAIVAATTNISEDETNAGFQWKKYDAPASLEPNEGYAAVYGGQLEGYVKNLQSTSYYNVRAFYKSAVGKYYYGDWVTFDPSDFSYFEPTVHTYAAEDVTESSAKVKGYVLAGTDEITEQGFEYWPAAEGESNAKAKRVTAAPEADGVETVLSTGQVMTAELKNLQPGTTYSLRAFVKTTAGTVYGEEQTFTTMGSATGISGIMSDGTAPTIEGYYDLGGRKLQQPRRGVNIVRYTDGSSRKVIIK